jgi:hypothetical protein
MTNEEAIDCLLSSDCYRMQSPESAPGRRLPHLLPSLARWTSTWVHRPPSASPPPAVAERARSAPAAMDMKAEEYNMIGRNCWCEEEVGSSCEEPVHPGNLRPPLHHLLLQSEAAPLYRAPDDSWFLDAVECMTAVLANALHVFYPATCSPAASGRTLMGR